MVGCRTASTLTIAIVPVLVGTALAWHQGGGINWLAAAIALCAAVLIQIGTNLYNDVGDYERGADGADRLGPPRATSMGWLAPADVRRAAATSFGLAMVLGAYLVSVGGWPIFVIGLASIMAGRRVHRRAATDRLHRFRRMSSCSCSSGWSRRPAATSSRPASSPGLRPRRER